MDCFFNYLKKTLTGLVFVMFAFVIVYVPQLPTSNVPEAEAQFPVIDVAAVAALTTIIGTTGAQTGKELTLDAIAFALGKSIISNMTSSLVDWINSGFQGSPAFVQDLDRFLLNAADEAAGEYIASLGEIGSYLCSDFRLDIQIALTSYYQRAREDRPYDGCRLSEVTENISGILEGTFTGDNWDDWLVITSRPDEYLPYGQYSQAQVQLDRRLAEIIGLEEEKLSWGSGFLSSKICETIEGPSGPKEQCVISTPGNVIADQINETLGVGRDQLIAADEINEIIGALIGQIANQALTGATGLLGLSANTGYASGGTSYTDALRQESREQLNNSTGRSTTISDLLDTQTEARLLARNYRDPLVEASNNPEATPDERSRAVTAVSRADEILDNTLRTIPELQRLLTLYNEREAAFENAESDEERYDAVIEQAAILAEAQELSGLYSEGVIRALESEWDNILSTL